MAQTRNMGYDSPVYQSVFPVVLAGTSTAANALSGTFLAGASTQSAKFVAFANMVVKSITTLATTVGTGTQTSFTLSSNAPALIRITNNGTTQVATNTGTYQTLGAYSLPAGATAIATGGIVMNYSFQTGTYIGTSAASVTGGVNNWALVSGGVPLAPGDQIYIVRGIDATEVIAPPVLECVIAPFGNITP